MVLCHVENNNHPCRHRLQPEIVHHFLPLHKKIKYTTTFFLSFYKLGTATHPVSVYTPQYKLVTRQGSLWSITFITVLQHLSFTFSGFSFCMMMLLCVNVCMLVMCAQNVQRRQQTDSKDKKKQGGKVQWRASTCTVKPQFPHTNTDATKNIYTHSDCRSTSVRHPSVKHQIKVC